MHQTEHKFIIHKYLRITKHFNNISMLEELIDAQ